MDARNLVAAQVLRQLSRHLRHTERLPGGVVLGLLEIIPASKRSQSGGKFPARWPLQIPGPPPKIDMAIFMRCMLGGIGDLQGAIPYRLHVEFSGSFAVRKQFIDTNDVVHRGVRRLFHRGVDVGFAAGRRADTMGWP